MTTPLSVDLVKVIVSGSIGTSGQTWSSGFHISVGGGPAPDQADLDSYLTNLQTPIETWITNIKTLWGTNTLYSGLKALYIPSGSLKATLVSVATVSATGGGTAAKLPGFCSLVASLRSSNPSRTGRGRMYLPANLITVSTDGEATNANAQTVANNTAIMMTAVNAIDPGFSAGAGVCTVASFASGGNFPIARIVCDTKIDVQHRRTDKLGADSTVTAVVTQ